MDKMLFLKVVWLFAFAKTASAGFTSCPDGWLAFKESCYLFGHTASTFTAAEHYCHQHGSHLVHVDSATENAFIRDQLRNMKHEEWWIGLTDRYIETIWTWIDDGNTPTYTDWAPGQPDDTSENEDCATFENRSGEDFQWNDITCTWKSFPVCERAPGPCGAEPVG